MTNECLNVLITRHPLVTLYLGLLSAIAFFKTKLIYVY